MHLHTVDVEHYGFQAAIKAEAALVSETPLEDTQETVDSLLIQVEGLNVVYARAPLTPGVLGSVTGQRGVRAQIVEEPEPAEGSLREARAIRVEFNEPRGFDEAIEEYVEPIRRILSIGIGATVHITALSVGMTPPLYTGDEVRCDVFAAGVRQTIDWAGTYESFRKPALIVDEDEPTLLHMIDEWWRLERQDHPLVDVFGAFIYSRDIHPRTRFLVAVQTLEGAWAVDNHDCLSKEDSQFQHDKDAALKALKNIPAAHRDFLTGALHSGKPHSLSTILRAYCAPFIDELEAMLADVDSVKQLVSSAEAKNPVDAVRVIRNHLSHGEKTYPAADLARIGVALERSIRAKLLGEMGATPTAQKNALRPPEDQGPSGTNP